MTRTSATLPLGESQWLGITLRSESDEPSEWWAIGWSIRNRVLSTRYPNTYEAVVTQPNQFSYFNRYGHLRGEELWAAANLGYAGDTVGWGENDLVEAVRCAAELIVAPRWRAPFGRNVLHYYSPVSMKPPGGAPSWAASGKRVIVSGIDPQRFTFVEGVA